MAYILGHKEFYGLDFKVNKNTLIPRPETELLVEEILKLKPKDKNIIDIGTGSGNIIISLAKNIKNNNTFWGVDISPKALSVARYNAKKNKAEKRIKFIKSDLLNFILKSKNHKLKTKELIIVANLPYLSQKIYSSAMPDVKNYEPKSALLSGPDGLNHYKKLLRQIRSLKKSYPALDVSCYMEISPEQKTILEKIIKNLFLSSKMEFKKDLARKWRLAIMKT